MLTLKIAIEVAGGGVGHSVVAGNGVDDGVHSDIGRITNGLAGIRNDSRKKKKQKQKQKQYIKE